VIVPIASLAVYKRLAHPGKAGRFRVVFCQFDSPPGDSLRVGETVFLSLREALRSTNDIDLQWEPESLPATASGTEVTAEVSRTDADLLIWAWYVSSPTSAQLTVKFATAGIPEIGFPRIGPSMPLVRPIADLQNFSLQLDLHRDLAALILAVRSRNSFDRGDWEATNAFYEQAIRQAPGARHQIEQNLGLLDAIALISLFRFPDADQLLTRLIACNCYPYPSRMLRADLNAQAGNFEIALDDLQSASRLAPSDCAPHVLRGFIYAGTGRFDQAIPEDQEATRHAECAEGAHASLVWIYLLRRQYREAEATATSYIQVSPQSAEPYARRAQARLAQGRLQDASRDLRLASSRDPAFPLTMLLEGQLALRQRDTDLAVDRFSKVLDSDTNSSAALIGRATALADKGREQAAERDLNAAIAVLESQRHGYLQRSTEHRQAGRGSLADFDLLRAEYTAAELGKALMLRASIRRQLLRSASAAEDYAAALKVARHVFANGAPQFKSTLSGV
jgi:tetratricopeptide (TPR) repeat protein